MCSYDIVWIPWFRLLCLRLCRKNDQSSLCDISYGNTEEICEGHSWRRLKIFSSSLNDFVVVAMRIRCFTKKKLRFIATIKIVFFLISVVLNIKRENQTWKKHEYNYGIVWNSSQSTNYGSPGSLVLTRIDESADLDAIFYDWLIIVLACSSHVSGSVHLPIA